ncbi:hypothetical protein M9H77_23509 [Catharanthus roseus]|uniref:Uncharacterized protein n=1 Tax=Catharanthus roseus TaxID=4058 RepID=A0ACC0AXK9_CATRO|nr:hypothetical protein M9H77_23509 [Catharanthus roseus]
MWGMIPSYFLDPFVGNFLVKKVEGYSYSFIGDLHDKSIRRNVEGYEFDDESFQRSADSMTQDKHENTESFQGSVTSFQVTVTRSRERKIEEETQRNKFGRV